jgi:hypothetical protein
MHCYLQSDGERFVALHPATMEKIRNLASMSFTSPTLFSEAQQEILQGIELLIYADYLTQTQQVTHRIPAPQPLSHNAWSARTTDSAANRAVLSMLSAPGSENVAAVDKLRVRAAEVNHRLTLECIETIEQFRDLSLENMPTAAHDVVDRFMASDGGGAKVFFSTRVQQELINTPKPHRSMFDNAQKEALSNLVAALLPHTARLFF